MGSRKKQTVGYWFRLLHHFGLCKGPLDAFLELRAGDRTAWRGLLTQSGRITVNKPDLWGGEKAEGGLVGDLDVMFGEPGQGANGYLAAQLGADQPTYRGKATCVWRGGRWGAMNPYPKPAAFKVRRILKGWDDDTPWYPEKAEIPLIPPEPLAIYLALDLSGSMDELTDNGKTRLANMKSAVVAALQFIGAALLPLAVRLDIMIVGWGGTPADYMARQSIIRRNVTPTGIGELVAWVKVRASAYWTYFPAAVVDAPGFFEEAAADAVRISIFVTDGEPSIPGGGDGATAAATAAGQTLLAIDRIRAYGINIDLADTAQTAKLDNTADDDVPVVKGSEPDALTNAILEALGGLVAMNPVHILYDSLTAADMQAEPVAMINDASFRAAADRCYAEAFGLCTTYADGTIEEFQARICDVIGASLTQSVVDGRYYVDLVRGDYELAALPVIGPDDIVEFGEDPSVLTERVNQIIVEWFDPQTKQTRATAPMQALGAIQAAGGVRGEKHAYPELAAEYLALRVAARDLQAESVPLSRFRLTLNRRTFDMRPGRQFRLQYPEEGITDMVCLLGEIDYGTLRDGRIRIVAVQDVFGMPQSVYVAPEPGLSPPASHPAASPHQRVIEAPRVELVTAMSRADLAYLPADVGLLMTIAAQPETGLNYTIYTAGVGEGYDERGTADWCPTATIVQAADYLDTEFALTDGQNLAEVELGSWALWDDEITRVDAIDPQAGTVTLGRGCADTVPARHTAGSRIWFCGDWGGTDGREYVDGETVRAKLLTRGSTVAQSLTTAPEQIVVMARRQHRPYPPGRLQINGANYPETIAGNAALSVAWSHRDRGLQDDQLIDTTVGDVGPEAGVSYTLRFFGEGGELGKTVAGIVGVSFDYPQADELAEMGVPYTGEQPWFPTDSKFGTTDIWSVAGSATGLIVAVGDAGMVSTSPDAIVWTARTSSLGMSDLRCVGFGNGLWVIAGGAGSLATSPTGVTWTARTSSFGTTFIRGVAYGNGVWAAVGSSGKAASSPNGTSWTQRTSSFGTTLIRDVTFGNGLFVAVGDEGKIATSPNAVDWTQRPNPAGTESILRVASGNGLWVAGGTNGLLMTSPDGITWTIRSSEFGSDNVQGVAYGAGQWVICGTSGKVASSPNGTSWTLVDDSTFGAATVRGAAYDGQWSIVGNGGAAAYRAAGDVSYRLNGQIRIELEAVRDGLASFQRHDVTVVRHGNGFNMGAWEG